MNPRYLFILSCLGSILMSGGTHGQVREPGNPLPSLTIEEAYILARQNYPLSSQRGLIRLSASYSMANARKGYLPQLNIAGQITRQSDVTRLPFKALVDGPALPELSRDQYRVYGEIDQMLYDGGLTHYQQRAVEVERQFRERQLDVNLYTVYDRVNELFFGILLLDRQLQGNLNLQTEIVTGITKAEIRPDSGAVFFAQMAELHARLMQATQSRIETQNIRSAYLEMLGLFIDRPLDSTTVLIAPPLDLSAFPLGITEHSAASIRRPELSLMEARKEQLNLQDHLMDAALRPRLDLFFQAGYGRPALNLFNNDPTGFYIGGIRMTWSFGGLYTRKNQRLLSETAKMSVNVERATFIFNTLLSMRQATAILQKCRAQLQSDNSILLLRAFVTETAATQLANGTLNAHDYLAQVEAEDQARQARIFHEFQFLQTQYTYRNLIGDHK